MSRYSINYRNQIRSRYDELDGRQIIQGNFHQITCDTLIFETMTGSAGYFNQINSTNTIIDSINPTVNVDITGDINLNGNINMTGGYYNYNSVPINNSFYPSLSKATTEKAVSKWTNGNDTSPALSSWNCLTWSPTLRLFAMVRQGGGTNNRIATSPDGINWTLYKSSNKSYQGIVWCSDLNGVGMFVATASNNPTGQEITISIDGITWTDVNTPSNLFAYGAVAYSPKLKRVVATSYSSGFAYSDDGFNWISVTPVQSVNNFYSITWSNELGLFATISAVVNNAINVSPDGINWTVITPSPSVPVLTSTSIAWSPELGIFCGVGEGRILISSDGYSWKSYVSSNLPFRNLTWCPQLRIFLGGTGASISYSYDGLNWSIRNIGFNGAKSSVWSPELGYFLIGGDRFHTARSYFAGRIPTSYNVFDSSLNNISELGLWNFQTFGRGTTVTKTTDFTVQPGESNIIVNRAATTTVTLPAATSWTGREIMIKTIQNQLVNSASSDVIPISGGVAGTAILTNVAGRYATLVSDGTNWVIMEAN